MVLSFILEEEQIESKITALDCLISLCDDLQVSDLKGVDPIFGKVSYVESG